MPMDFRLLRPTRSAPLQPSFPTVTVSPYNPDMIFLFPDGNDYNSESGLAQNVIELFSLCLQYGVGLRVVWTLIGLTFDPPTNPSTSYYYAPNQDPGDSWELPPTNTEFPTQAVIQCNWFGGTISPVFNQNAECTTVWTELAEDGLLTPFRSLPLGGVGILFESRSYVVSTDPALGAAWCIKRSVEVDDTEGFFTSGPPYQESVYHFASGYAYGAEEAGVVKDAFGDENNPNEYPQAFTGGPTPGGWS
jgi:hypothetical protein